MAIVEKPKKTYRLLPNVLWWPCSLLVFLRTPEVGIVLNLSLHFGKNDPRVLIKLLS